MGGSSGGVIVRRNARTALSDPTVHGQMPTSMQYAVDAVLAKDDGDWSAVDCLVMAGAYAWALAHCN